MESTNTNHRSENLSTSQNKDTEKIGLNNFSDALDDAFQNEETAHEQNRKKYIIDVNEVILKPQVAWSLKNIKSEGEAILGTLGDFGSGWPTCVQIRLTAFCT